MIFSMFRFFCTLRFQIYKYCPIIHQWEAYLKWTLMAVLWSRVTYECDDMQKGLNGGINCTL